MEKARKALAPRHGQRTHRKLHLSSGGRARWSVNSTQHLPCRFEDDLNRNLLHTVAISAVILRAEIEAGASRTLRPDDMSILIHGSPLYRVGRTVQCNLLNPHSGRQVHRSIIARNEERSLREKRNEVFQPLYHEG